MTVTSLAEGEFTADVMGETLAKTSLGGLAPGSPVNLERPVAAGGRLDGHIVQGHVDGTGVVIESRRPIAGTSCESPLCPRSCVT